MKTFYYGASTVLALAATVMFALQLDANATYTVGFAVLVHLWGDRRERAAQKPPTVIHIHASGVSADEIYREFRQRAMGAGAGQFYP